MKSLAWLTRPILVLLTLIILKCLTTDFIDTVRAQEELVVYIPPPPDASLIAETKVIRLNGLIGQTEKEVTHSLGQPEKLNGSIWHYDMGECTVDLHFYYDPRSETQRMLHFKTNDACR